MSIASFSRFEGTDFIAFAVCGAVGYFVGSFAPEGSAVAIYGAILVSYHLFLAWLILFSGGDHKEAGVSLPLGHTVVTHLACLAVIIAPIAIARHTIPNFGSPQDNHTLEGVEATRHTIRVIQALCCSIAGFAIFERGWLFSSEAPIQREKPLDAAPAPAPVALTPTAEDMEAWHKYLAQQKPSERAMGGPMKTEFERWMVARQQSREAKIQEGPRT